MWNVSRLWVSTIWWFKSRSFLSPAEETGMFEKGWRGLSHGYEACGGFLCTSGKQKCAFCLNLGRYLNPELEVIRKTSGLLELMNLVTVPCVLYWQSQVNLLPLVMRRKLTGSKCNQIWCETSWKVISSAYSHMLLCFRSHSHHITSHPCKQQDLCPCGLARFTGVWHVLQQTYFFLILCIFWCWTVLRHILYTL